MRWPRLWLTFLGCLTLVLTVACSFIAPIQSYLNATSTATVTFIPASPSPGVASVSLPGPSATPTLILHDSLGQVLGYVKMQAQAARGLLAQYQSAEADHYLAQLVAVAQDAHADVREYILGAQTGMSAEAGFLPALDQYLRRFSQNYGIATELSAPPEFSDRAFEPMVEAQLLRIIQEALTNVRKHARAHFVHVNLSCSDGRAEAIVQEDGAGFDPEVLGTAEGQRFGLRFMQERAAGVGGRVEVHSTPDEGTQVIISVPLRKDGR